MTQYHYLDESGDPGLGGEPGSSNALTLAMVQLADTVPLSALAAVRQQFHLSPQFEFKYHSTKPRQKTAFFNAIQAVPFRVRAVVMPKTSLDASLSRLDGQSLTIELITRLTLRASELDIAKDVLIVDGATPTFCRALRIRLSAECRHAERVRPFAKIVGGRSAREDGLQLADMLTGAVRAHVMEGESEYYAMVASKVVDLWTVAARKQ